MTVQQQALDALLSFGRTARVEGRACSGFHWLGDSPHDADYRVKLTLTVRHDLESRSYRVGLAISEERYEGGFASQRYGFGMAARHLADVAVSRFGRQRAEDIYSEALLALRTNPQPLIDLLTEESNRT